MTAERPDADYGSLSAALRFVIGAALRDIQTAMPAVVRSYDAARRRAAVQPALKMVLTDGSLRRRPPIADVPVIFPGSARALLHFPLQKGDAVMLVCSSRGMTRFKRALSETAPEERILSLQDAVALAGFGPAGGVTQLAGVDGPALQTVDGAAGVGIGGGDLRGTGEEVTVESTGGSVRVVGATEVTVEAATSITLRAPLIKLVAPSVQSKSPVATNPLLT